MLCHIVLKKRKLFRIVGVRTSLSEDIEKKIKKNVPLFWDRVFTELSI